MSNLLKVLLLCLVFACSNAKEKTEKRVSDHTSLDVKKEAPVKTVSTEGTADGKMLYITCIACHGDKGQGNQALGAPALVNQEGWYLKRQLNNFKRGIRGSDPEDVNGIQMAAIAKTIKDEAAMDAVIDYIKTFPKVITKKTVAGDVENGKQYYNMICGACHGPNAKGNKILNAPRLTGIDDWYLVDQYKKFRDNKRGVHPEDTFGKQMQLMSNALPTEEAINNVIAYIHSIKEKL
jgi:cytochrome c oxidase subunit 2